MVSGNGTICLISNVCLGFEWTGSIYWIDPLLSALFPNGKVISRNLRLRCQLPPAVCSTTDVCFVEFACFSANAYTFRFHQLLLALTFLHILSWKSLCHAIAGFILHRFVARARGWRHHPGLYDEMLNASFSLSSSSTGSLASSWKLNNISAESALCNFQLNFSEWGSV